MKLAGIAAAVLAAAGLAVLTLAAAGSVKTLPPPSPACRQWQAMSGPLEAALKDGGNWWQGLTDGEVALVAWDATQTAHLAALASDEGNTQLAADLSKLGADLRQLGFDNGPDMWPSKASVLNVPEDADAATVDAAGADMDCNS